LKIYGERINVNQMQVLYNTLKKPVTFVQGPPGTGKTQTILNVILSAFYNDKTVLICSNNNKPVDGIIQKLELTYHDKTIPFPFLRLGNVRDVQKATKKILKYSRMGIDSIDDKELEALKMKDWENHRELLEQLKIYEEVNELEVFINNSNRFVQSFDENTESPMITLIRRKIEEKQRELNAKLAEKREDLHSLFTPMNENKNTSRYFYYKSMDYLRKLKKPRYSELIRICSERNSEIRSKRFNDWCQDNDNVR